MTNLRSRFYLLLSLCVSFTAQIAIAESEPNNLSTQASQLSPGSAMAGTIDTGLDDIDWYSISANAGSTLQIDISSQSTNRDRNGDLVISVLRSSDAYLMGGYRISPSNSALTIQLTIDESDDYLISIHNDDYLSTPLSYQLDIASQQDSRTTDSINGLWRVGNEGYASIHQDGDEIAVVVMGYSNAAGFRWETLSGTMRGETAKIKTTIGYVSMEIDALFTSSSRAEFTVQSCSTIIEGNPCRFRPGITFYLEKMESWR